MWFFGKRKLRPASMERRIQAVHKQTLQKIELAKQSTEKLNKRLDSEDDITYLIFLATGGDRRGRR